LQSTHTNPAAAVPFAGNSAGDSLREGCFWFSVMPKKGPAAGSWSRFMIQLYASRVCGRRLFWYHNYLDGGWCLWDLPPGLLRDGINPTLDGWAFQLRPFFPYCHCIKWSRLGYSGSFYSLTRWAKKITYPQPLISVMIYWK
jgi:hypothetical protein